MRPLAAAENKDAEFTPLSLFNFFINRCRENLHIILAMSPIGDAFRNRLRKFPSLINCCTIDWFQAWPDDALELVAHKFLEDVQLESEERSAAISLCKHFHQSTRELSERSDNCYMLPACTALKTQIAFLYTTPNKCTCMCACVFLQV